MNKHKFLIYPKLDASYNGSDYSDGGREVEQNHRPMVGDVIVDLQDEYPYSIRVIETLML